MLILRIQVRQPPSWLRLLFSSLTTSRGSAAVALRVNPYPRYTRGMPELSPLFKDPPGVGVPSPKVYQSVNLLATVMPEP